MCFVSVSGFGTTLGSKPSKSVTMSIIRTMEMNGTLETRPARLAPPNHNNILEIEQKAEEIQEDEDDIDEEDEEEDVKIRDSKQGMTVTHMNIPNITVLVNAL